MLCCITMKSLFNVQTYYDIIRIPGLLYSNTHLNTSINCEKLSYAIKHFKRTFIGGLPT